MLDTTRALNLPTPASTVPTESQRRIAGAVSLGFAAISIALLPIVSQQMAPMPGFIPSY